MSNPDCIAAMPGNADTTRIGHQAFAVTTLLCVKCIGMIHRERAYFKRCKKTDELVKTLGSKPQFPHCAGAIGCDEFKLADA